MRKLLIFLFLLCLSTVNAQIKTVEVSDSTGTATTYWQTITLPILEVNGVEVINDGTSGNIIVAGVKADTVAGRTRYQRAVKPGEILKIPNFSNGKIFVKTSAGSIDYRVGTY